MLKKRSSVLIAGLAVLLGIVPVANAQSDVEVNAGIRFNFTPPGARSLGMGGAFLALADDATAAVTNPAGLIQLQKPEIMVEGLSSDFTTVFADGGRRFGSPSRVAVPMTRSEKECTVELVGSCLDTFSKIQFGESDSSTSGLSFLSFVYPRDRWSLALYRHELANFEASFRRQGPFFPGKEAAGDVFAFRVFPADAQTDLEIINWGVSGAFQVNEVFSIGAGVSLADFSLDSVTKRYHPQGPFIDEFGNYLPEAQGGTRDSLNRFLPGQFIATNLNKTDIEAGDDDDVSFNLGLLITPRGSRWTIAASYREGPEFDLPVTSVFGPSSDFCADGQTKQCAFLATGLPAREGDEELTQHKFKVPDSYGVGFSFAASDNLTLSLDFMRVLYSQMARSRSPEVPYDASDTNEVHLGLEWRLDAENPVFLRAGIWRDPDHRFAIDDNDVDRDISNHLRKGSIFLEGSDETHYSLGAGIVINNNFLIDAAVDFSDPVTTATAAFTIRFGT